MDMKGWIKSIRKSKDLTFLSVTDGSKDSQVTIKSDVPISGELKVGASFEAQGCESLTPRGLPEFLASEFKIVGVSDDEYPIQPKAHTLDFLRTIPELRGRTKGFQSIWKIRHILTQAVHRYFDSQGFTLFQTPIIIDSDCEGAGETFQVKSDWLDQILTVSSQLHLETGMMSLGEVYTLSPCFRAEKSATRKHLSEFHMLEVEHRVKTLDELMLFAERSVKDVLKDVVSRAGYEFSQLGIKDIFIQDIIDSEWKVKTYDEICKTFGIFWGQDISSEMEQTIVQHYGAPTFITHYPKDLKPFYMLKDDRVAYCFDLIFPEVGELIGGSQREDSYDKLKESMVSSGLDLDKMGWYLSTRRWGSVPHGGWGLGMERLLMFITKSQKIHDVIPFPVSY